MPTTEIDFNFSPERVKTIRVRLGLTQDQFAAKIGVNPNIISRWELGQAVPTRGPSLKALLDAEQEAGA